MPSKKASFESRDPSHLAETPANSKGDHSRSTSAPAFESRDPAHGAGSTLDFTTEEKIPAPPGKASFESRDLSLDYPSDPSQSRSGAKVSDKASFYSSDPDLGSSDPSKRAKKKYSGVERRRANRRSGTDRRADVRFDLDKNDRRQNEGRRESDHTPKYW